MASRPVAVGGRARRRRSEQAQQEEQRAHDEPAGKDVPGARRPIDREQFVEPAAVINQGGDVHLWSPRTAASQDATKPNRWPGSSAGRLAAAVLGITRAAAAARIRNRPTPGR